MAKSNVELMKDMTIAELLAISPSEVRLLEISERVVEFSDVAVEPIVDIEREIK